MPVSVLESAMRCLDHSVCQELAAIAIPRIDAMAYDDSVLMGGHKEIP